MEIKASSRFKKNYKKLSPLVKRKAERKEAVFIRNPFDPRLQTHKLQGRYKEAWAYSVDHSCRIIFIFLNHDKVFYINIGTHEIYK